ncbi:hypothetical protein ACFL6C_04655 [Myxococcota bacterium]
MSRSGLMTVTTTLTLVLFAVACGTARSYRLPLDVSEARHTFAAIVAVAGEEGLRVAEHADSVNIQFDDATWIQFMIQERYNMVIIVNDTKVPSSEVEQRFADARHKGDEIWEKAIASDSGTPGPPTTSSTPE